jgi:hypothetical protein
MPNFNQNLLPGETVLFKTQYHWTNTKGFFVWATLACGVSVSLLGAWWYKQMSLLRRSATAAPAQSRPS